MMTDLHSHILPGIDDGSKSTEMSLELLWREYKDNVTQIAFTPHFNFERQRMQDFLQKRNSIAEDLKKELKRAGLTQRIKLGAEVFYSSQLAETDVRPLCLTGTDLLLIEFLPAYYPREAPDVLYQLTRQGIVPLIAHVERYAFVQSDPNILCDLIEAGVYTQMNATSLVMHKRHRKLLLQMVHHNMIHVLGTDTHSPLKRPPKLGDAMELVRKKYGEKTVRQLIKNADDLFNGVCPERPDPQPMRQIFGHWI